MQQLAFSFNPEHTTEGGAEFKNLLGNKGAHLCEMSKLGLPVPEGVVISTEAFKQFQEQKTKVAKLVYCEDLVKNHVAPLLHKIAEDQTRPTLWSVRSGAAVSMAGMMDTLLNVGINNESINELKLHYGAPMVLDSLVTYLEAFYSDKPEEVTKLKALVESLPDYPILLDAKQAEEALELFATDYSNSALTPNLIDQITLAVLRVFLSWDNKRAVEYRRINGIDPELGTAVIIQKMVYGNLNTKSGSGVLFSTCPNTGDKVEGVIYGEYLPQHQGEKLVNGSTTPLTIEAARDDRHLSNGMFRKLLELGDQLEQHYGDIQDVEFTIEDKRLYVLQTRSAKRTGKAAVNYALRKFSRGDITREELTSLIKPRQALDAISDSIHERDMLDKFKGIPAGHGIVTGVPCHTEEQIKIAKSKGHTPIFYAYETSTDDLHLINECDAVVTASGGFTSHAAVVCRALNKPCIVGVIETSNARYRDFNEFMAQATITIDASSGIIYLAEAVDVIRGSENQLRPLFEALGIETGDSRSNLEISNLEPLELVQILRMRLKNGHVALKYSAHRTGSINGIFGEQILPTNLKPIIDQLVKTYEEGQTNFSLVCDYAIENMYNNALNFLVTTATKPNEYLDKSVLVSNDAVLSTVFGTLAAAKKFLGALEGTGAETASVYEEYTPPLHKLLKLLHEGSN
ncbi:pyruvate phosphate dikinase [Vibrio phage vB_VhaS-a]|nr:pyruvate phosphate dikinase [Vibrio phage vB_VhaS-a]